jgi:glucose/arabinose dehydrogenase
MIPARRHAPLSPRSNNALMDQPMYPARAAGRAPFARLAAQLLLTLIIVGCGKAEERPEAARRAETSTHPAPPAAKPTPEPPATTQPSRPLKLVPHKLDLGKGKSITLSVPPGLDISVAASGLRRVRFMAKSPDGRIFATDMYDRTDNRKGTIYILSGLDRATGRFASVTPYLSHLRNPNSIAFHADPDGAAWLYVALTDSLVRYRYNPGDNAPTSAPQLLATFPDYGLSYKYGGWHLTRTVAFGPNGKLYVAVGSSCNACEEKEDVRASIVEMNPDGSGRRIYASGLRNAVGLKFVGETLFATNMGADHLGDDRPEDQLVVVREGANYGWPYCYQYHGKIYADPMFASSEKRVDPAKVPLGYSGFLAHSAPLGLEYFDSTNSDPDIANSFLVALHGASKISLRHGYSVARVRKGEPTLDVMSGFLSGGHVSGRPADVLSLGPDAFLVTDDDAGAIYYLRRR